MKIRTNYKTTKHKRKQKSKNAYAFAISFSFARIQRIGICASMCACVCARLCKYFISLLHSFSPPLFKFIPAQKPFLRYSIVAYNQIEVKRWITIIATINMLSLIGIEVYVRVVQKRNGYSKRAFLLHRIATGIQKRSM